VIRVTYEGPARGAHILADQLRAEALEVEYESPGEYRSIKQEAVRVILHVASVGEDAVIGAVALGAAQRVIRKFKDRYPGDEDDS
jgi:hypothetical protein